MTDHNHNPADPFAPEPALLEAATADFRNIIDSSATADQAEREIVGIMRNGAAANAAQFSDRLVSYINLQ